MNHSSINFYPSGQYQDIISPQGRDDRCCWEDEGNYSYIEDTSLTYCDQEEPHPVVRVVKRRNTANKKERKRTETINNAFDALRLHIPNIQVDTKLSKIKTLRLATSYISYLMGVLENEECGDGFKADLSSLPRRAASSHGTREDMKKNKGRTGWPQHVWALELKHEGV